MRNYLPDKKKIGNINYAHARLKEVTDILELNSSFSHNFVSQFITYIELNRLQCVIIYLL